MLMGPALAAWDLQQADLLASTAQPKVHLFVAGHERNEAGAWCLAVHRSWSIGLFASSGPMAPLYRIHQGDALVQSNELLRTSLCTDTQRRPVGRVWQGASSVLRQAAKAQSMPVFPARNRGTRHSN
jgi:hypothetical protein